MVRPATLRDHSHDYFLDLHQFLLARADSGRLPSDAILRLRELLEKGEGWDVILIFGVTCLVGGHVLEKADGGIDMVTHAELVSQLRPQAAS